MDLRVVHDACEVEFISKLGTDLTVVNAARVSFGKASEELTDRDKKLIGYLAREQHFSPFRHCMIQVRIKVPEFVARQLYKHCVGIECTSTHPTKDHAWSEVSTRYKVMHEVYIPRIWHRQHPTAKQCSGDEHTESEAIKLMANETIQNIWTAYHKMLDKGVAKEQARMFLPLSFMTEVIWTASLQAVHHFVVLRKDPHAQKEIRDLADILDTICTREFPVAYAALSQSTCLPSVST
jgi:thymidylate synthase (FAD)